MTDPLLHAYLPLFFWTGLGIISLRFLPEALPRFLGRALYWVGVPLEILALARQTNFSVQVGLAPVVTIATIVSGLVLAWVSLQIMCTLQAQSTPTNKTGIPDEIEKQDGLSNDNSMVLSWQNWQRRPLQGSFLISAILGNTGFVGLAIVPAFIDPAYLSWAVIYSVTQNVMGTYGLGVFLASRFGRSMEDNAWWMQVRDVVTVPSLWAFVIGAATQSIGMPAVLESGLRASIWVVIPTALLLMGMRVSQLKGWKSLQMAIVPAVLKTLVLPVGAGIAITLLGITGDARLALVLMAGMPTAFAGLILAEEYELDRELIASSIVLTTAALILTIPVWLFVFRKGF